MNKELFDSMQEQMKPSPEVRAALSEKLTQPVKRRTPVRKYVALAACAALVIGVFPLYQTIQGRLEELDNIRAQEGGSAANITAVKYHSFVTVDDVTGTVTESTTTAAGGSEGGGDRDMGMTPDDLTQAMLDVGYTQEEINEYQSSGYQMTWAKWWKFVHQQRDSEGSDPFNLDDLRIFSQVEVDINTGGLPGGAYIGDVPSQEEAVNAYQTLMDRFNGDYPDWYGGAYIDNTATLVVCLVESKDSGDKSLELQVMDWTDNGRVAFTDVKYSLAYLHELMDQLNALPEADPQCREFMAGWGVDEEANHIELTLTQANVHVLSVLAELDPEDDALLVKIGQRATADVGSEDPAVHHVIPGGVTVPDDEDLIAVEPYYDGAHYDVENLPEQLPESKRPALKVDSVPEEDTPSRTEDASTASWFPGN